MTRYTVTIQNPNYSREVFVWDKQAWQMALDEKGGPLSWSYSDLPSQQVAIAKATAAAKLLNDGETIPHRRLVKP